MRWTILTQITWKETRDLLRDRRTTAMLFLAPLLLYPLFGLAGWIFATELIGKPTRLGVVNAGAAAVGSKYPALLDGDHFADSLTRKRDDGKPELPPVVIRLDEADIDEALRTKRVQAVMVLPVDFGEALNSGAKPTIKVLSREGDDAGKIALTRLTELLRNWEQQAKLVKFTADGKPADYDRLIAIDDPRAAKPLERKAAEELRDSFARGFPLILVMWLVAGSIQPAVDLTAGEKERGTMETLLISPAHRSEIVLGKFAAVTAFSFASVLWNVVCLTVAALFAQSVLQYPIVSVPGLATCVLFSLPIAMLFSAVSIALGVFARSTKEGQYYLVPLLLVVMPLAFWCMIPSTELTPGSAMVPVAGAILFQQKLLAVTGEPVPWLYAVPVLAAQLGYAALALTAAWWQFTREQVLFREIGGK